MNRIDIFRQYATDCMRQAEGAQRSEDKTILLNMALAWVRLAQQSQDADADNAAPVPAGAFAPAPSAAASPAA